MDSYDFATFQTPNLKSYIGTDFHDFLDSDIL